MAEIDRFGPLQPIMPHRHTRKVDEEARARDERQRRQQQQKYRRPARPEEESSENDKRDGPPSIDEYA